MRRRGLRRLERGWSASARVWPSCAAGRKLAAKCANGARQGSRAPARARCGGGRWWARCVAGEAAAAAQKGWSWYCPPAQASPPPCLQSWAPAWARGALGRARCCARTLCQSAQAMLGRCRGRAASAAPVPFRRGHPEIPVRGRCKATVTQRASRSTPSSLGPEHRHVMLDPRCPCAQCSHPQLHILCQLSDGNPQVVQGQQLREIEGARPPRSVKIRIILSAAGLHQLIVITSQQPRARQCRQLSGGGREGEAKGISNGQQGCWRAGCARLRCGELRCGGQRAPPAVVRRWMG